MVDIVSVIAGLDSRSKSFNVREHRGSGWSHESLRSREESWEEGDFGEGSNLGIGEDAALTQDG